jgi:hypothetical protein
MHAIQLYAPTLYTRSGPGLRIILLWRLELAGVRKQWLDSGSWEDRHRGTPFPSILLPSACLWVDLEPNVGICFYVCFNIFRWGPKQQHSLVSISHPNVWWSEALRGKDYDTNAISPWLPLEHYPTNCWRASSNTTFIEFPANKYAGPSLNASLNYANHSNSALPARIRAFYGTTTLVLAHPFQSNCVPVEFLWRVFRTINSLVKISETFTTASSLFPLNHLD